MKTLSFLAIAILLTACGTTDSKMEKKKIPEIKGKIVFTNQKQVFTMNADGSNLTEITDLGEGAFSPSWSPNGRKIIFSTGLNATTAGPSIYIINADGSNLHPMKMLECCPAAGWDAKWSPDGRKIAFSNCINCEGGGGNYEIFIYDISADSVIRLTTATGSDRSPEWSPSGEQIIFSSERDYLNDEYSYTDDLYMINPTTIKTNRLTQIKFLGDYTWISSKKLIYTYYNTDGPDKVFLLNTTANEKTFVMEAEESPAVVWDSVNNRIITLTFEPKESVLILSAYNLNGKFLISTELTLPILRAAWNFDIIFSKAKIEH